MNSNCPDCNKALRNPKKCSCGWTMQEANAEGAASSSGCAAHGCPLHGSISSSVSGGSMFMCAMHFRAHASNWHEVTARIRRNMTLVNLIREIRMTQNGRPFDYKTWMATLSHSAPQYIPNDDDRRRNGKFSMRKWQERLEKELFALVMPGMDGEQSGNGQSRNAEEIMNHIEDFLKAHSMERRAA